LRLKAEEPAGDTGAQRQLHFAADLIRAMHHAGLSPEVDFMILASHRAATPSGQVEVLCDIESPIANRDVMLG
jgi:hypoxanthine phosphoribosyltransferase